MSSLVRAIKKIAFSGDKSQALYPGGTSVCLDSDKATQQEIAALALSLSNKFRQTTVRRDCIILAIPHGPDFAAALLACFCASIVAIPTVPRGLAATNEDAETVWSQYKQCREAGSTCAVVGSASIVKRLTSHRYAAPDDVFVLEELLEEVIALKAELRVAEASVAVLLMTSGSEGPPKGIPLNHRSIWRQIRTGREQWCITASSRPVTWLSPSHNFGLHFGVLVPFFTGASCRVVAPQVFAKHPERWFHAIASHQATHLAMPNFAFDFCSDVVRKDKVPPETFSSVSHLICGGEPIQRDAAHRFFNNFASLGAQLSTLQPHYGMSECGSITTAPTGTDPFISLDTAALASNSVQPSNTGDAQSWFATCGPISLKDKIKIWNFDQAILCNEKQIGEIVVAADGLMEEYWFTDADACATPFLDLPDGSGRYFKTGDLGFVADGNLCITGRNKEVIIQRGKNHYPAAIEGTVAKSLQNVGVTCAVFVRDGPLENDVIVILGVEEEIARTILSSATGASELAKRVRKAISKVHGLHVADVIVVERSAIFGSPVSKLKRGPLKAAYAEGTLPILWSEDRVSENRADKELQATYPSIIATLRDNVFAHVLGANAKGLSEDTDFGEFGLDSLQCARIAGSIENTFGQEFNPTLLFSHTTLRKVAEYLSSNKDESSCNIERKEPIQCRSSQHALDDPVAIVGMHCEIPGAGTGTDNFWKFLARAGNGVGMIANQRPNLWRSLTQFAPNLQDHVPRHAGLLPNIDMFDADFFGISRREAECMDPQQRKVLQFIWNLCEVSGHRPSTWDGHAIGLFIGAHSKDYADLLAVRPDVMVSSGAYIDSGTHLTMISNRASRWFNFKGPSEVINTACSSSLVALHRAVCSMRAGECQSALVLGVNLISAPVAFLSSAQADMLSKDGSCKTLDAKADGFVRSEALAGVMLKPLSAAKADGDRIYGLIRATGVNHDGRSNSLRAPNGASQRDLLLSVYDGSGIDPASVSYVELHGTGTVLGDPIEVRALAEAFQQLSPTTRRGACAVGSVKANIGHAESAAGLVGLVKVLLCLQHKTLVKTPHLTTLNPHIDLEKTPFRALWENEAWVPDTSEVPAPLRAGLSSFGFGGVNAHAIIESYEAVPQATGDKNPLAEPPHVFVLSAKSDTQLTDRAQQLLEWLDNSGCEERDLADLARTLQLGREELDVRMGIIAATLDGVKTGLSEFLAGASGISGVATGRKAKNPSAFHALQADWTFSQTVTSWIVNCNLAPLLELWVQGYHINWVDFWVGERRPRLSLPPYPFAQESYWLPDEPSPRSTLPDSPRALQLDARIQKEGMTDLSSDVLGDLAALLKTSSSEIDTTLSFSEIGLDSIGISKFTEHLNTKFRWEISPTLFYECTTVQDLLGYLQKTFGQTELEFGSTSTEPQWFPSKNEPTIPAVATKTDKSRDVAIIGLSGSFPNSPDITSFWNNLSLGHDCISEIPDTRWGGLAKNETRFAGIIQDIAQFDPMFFGISPREALSMDPQQRLLLTHAWQALEDAGYAPEGLAGTDTAVIVGSERSGYSELLVNSGQPIESFSAIGMVASMGPNRLSNLLDLHGPSEPIETACSSSLVAINRAVDLLRRRECSIALAGGVNTIISRELHLGFGKAGMLSDDGRCKTFSAEANGYVRGEGVGILVLKSLDQAERDGDRIYAKILGTATNHGGRSASLTAPNPRAQASLIREAIADANVDPKTISYIELHGTGTPLGDPIEFEGLMMALSQDSVSGRAHCGLGSVKSNIGHLELAAGVAGTIKVVLQMQHQTLAPSLHSANINPKIAIETSPFYLVQERQSWVPTTDSSGCSAPLRAGVSSFGAGGMNAHLILENYPQPAAATQNSDEPVLIVLSARTREQLSQQVRRLQVWLSQNPTTEIRSLAYTLQVGRNAMPHRLAMIAATHEALHAQLFQFLSEGTTTELGFLSPENGALKRAQSPFATVTQFCSDESFGKGNLAVLAREWVSGVSVDWAALYPNSRPRKLSLPTYPFSQDTYWPSFTSCSNDLRSTARGETRPGDLVIKALHWRSTDDVPAEVADMQINRRVITIGLNDATNTRLAAAADTIALEWHSENFAESFEKTIVALTEIIQTQYPRPRLQPLLLQIVVPATGEESLLAAIAGWLRTLHQERPDLCGQLVAIDSPAPQNLHYLLIHNAAMREDTVVKYLDGTRFVPTWQDLPTQAPSKAVWAADGTYVITGGLGGLGRGIIQDLRAKVPAANLVLLGRSTPTDQDWAFITALRCTGDGDVRYETVDISDAEAVAYIMAQIVDRYGGLTGIIHSAGVVCDSLIKNKTPGSIQAVLAAKVAGTRNLDEATQGIALELFVCFSSLVALLGNQGQSDYAAANAFLDHFADYRNRLVAEGKRRGQTLSINWPIWDSGGMQISDSNRRAIFERTGLVPLPLSTGVKALEAALASKCTQLLVAHGDSTRFLRLLATGKEAEATLPDSTFDAAGVRDARSLIITTIANGLKLSVAELDLDAGLETYGLDSLMATQLIDDLESILGTLPKTLFFEHATLRSLIDDVIGNYGTQLQRHVERTPIVPETATCRSLSMAVAEVPNTSRPDAQDIAVIGLAGTYPGARTLDEFWANLRSGKDSIIEIPSTRWDHMPFFDPDRKTSGKTYSKWGGFIEGHDEFDPLLFNISPRDANLMDPQERLFLQCAHSAIEDAGYTPQTLGSSPIGNSVAVFAGAMYSEYQLYGAQEQMNGRSIALNGILASIANRVSYCFDFRGPSMSVDTMCSSSLAAIHMACQSLKLGDCEVALAGGVNLSLHPNKYLGLAQGNFLSSTGRCRSFGQGGDGYVPAEGVGVVILKPLGRAIQDRDSIYAVIRGTALNNGGKTNGYSVPNPNAQADVIRAALDQANVDPASITYVEAHGTGTQLGDPIEIVGLNKAFGLPRNSPATCAIGSVKSNIGHCEAAAGVAAVTKVLLQLRAKEIAPSLHADTLNENIDFDVTPFRVQTRLVPWTRAKDIPRRAGVSSFGAGGTNVHVVIEEYPTSSHSETEDTGPQAIVLSANTSQDLMDRVKNLHGWLGSSNVALDRIAYTLQVGRTAMAARMACVATSRDDLRAKLAAVLSNTTGMQEVFIGDIRSGRSEVNELRADPARQKVLNEQLVNRDFAAPLAAWVNGFDLDWHKARSVPPPQRAHLPTYPFAREKHWAPSRRGLSGAQKNITSGSSLKLTVTPRADDPILATVLDHISDTSGAAIDRLDPDVSFRDYGIDSVHAIDLHAALCETFDVDLSPTAPFVFETANTLAAHIRGLRNRDIHCKSKRRDKTTESKHDVQHLGLSQIQLPGEGECSVALFYATGEDSHFLNLGGFTLNAALNAEPLTNPKGLILISHGFGGTGFSHHNLARHLAMHGYLVAAPHHTADRLLLGKTQLENQLFLKRTYQLRRTLDFLLTHSAWGPALEGCPIGAIGHSGGGAAILALLGAKLAAEDSCVPESLSDPRVSSALLMAPMGISFETKALSSISTPLWILTAQKDEYRDDPKSEGFYIANLSNARHDDVPEAGHFSFMSLPDEPRSTGAPNHLPIMDPKGFDRTAFEASHHAAVEAYFNRHLVRPKQNTEQSKILSAPKTLKSAQLHAVLFPGQGSQAKGMGQALFDEDPEFVAHEEDINDLLGYSVRDLCINGPRETLNQTQYTQPCIYVVNALHYAAHLETHPTPTHVAGHSLGEYNALTAAGVFDFFTGLKIVKARAELMGQVKYGAMAAVIGLLAEEVADIVARHHPMLDLANFNAPRQTVVSGPRNDIQQAKETFKAANAEHYMILPVSAAFHSRCMTPAAQGIAQVLKEVPITAPEISVISNLHAKPYPSTVDDIRATLADQITHSVQWTKTVRYLLDQGVDSIIEAGHGTTLTHLVDQIRMQG